MLIVGWLFTALWLVGLVAVVALNFDSAIELELNSWGDFLSGGFAPLAFFWLVLGYFQQGKELKLSREALLLQASELRSSVLQQEQLVLATREDIELSKGEMKRRLLAERKKVEPLFVLVKSIVTDISETETYCWFTFSNQGSNVRRAFVSAKTKPSLIRVDMEQEPSGWDNWQCETTKNIVVTLSKSVFVMLEVLAISITYIDSNGEEGKALITFSMDAGKIVSVKFAYSFIDC